MNEQKSKVAQFLTHQSQKSGKTAVQIASDAGYDKSNIISMLRSGATKLPLDRVPAMAKALDVDPLVLMRLCMEEYMPDVLSILDELKMFSGISTNEEKIIKELRKLTRSGDPTLHGGNAVYLKQFVET